MRTPAGARANALGSAGPRSPSYVVDLATLVRDVAERGAGSQEALRRLYDLTTDDLRAAVGGWVRRESDTYGAVTDDIIVATYAEVWRQAARRPTETSVRTWLTALALAQLWSRHTTLAKS